MKKWTLLAALAAMGLGAATFTTRGQSDPLPGGSDMVAFGTKVKPFSLPDPATGQTTNVGAWDGAKATVILFIATRCPVSNAYNGRMAGLAKEYSAKGIKFYGINSNKTEAPGAVAAHAKNQGFSFPVLKDAGNKIADRFNAQVTPEAYVINAAGDLVYHGDFDDAKEESEVTRRDLKNALDAILAGKPVAPKETQAFGCSIKRQ